MVYLVIIFVVASLGITRLWLQQRREQSQMDTIQGFNSALEAMSPPMTSARRRVVRNVRRPRRRIRRPGLLQGWFVARPTGAQIERRVASKRKAVRRDPAFDELDARRGPVRGATSQYERYAG